MFEKETRDTLLGAMNIIDKFLESKASLTTDNSGVRKLRRMLFSEYRSRPVPAADAPAPAHPAAVRAELLNQRAARLAARNASEPS
jgi:hypothetical protein